MIGTSYAQYMGNIGNTQEYSSPIIKLHESPLKQFKTEIPFDEIRCNNNLVLIQKYDGSPACIKPESRNKLLLREWTIHTVSKSTFSHYRIDCNNQKNPYQEYWCFKEAFSKCLNAFINPEIHITEGEQEYTNLRITPACKIEVMTDLKDDRWESASVTFVCNTIDSDEYSWSVKNCDFEKIPEMKFNFMISN